MPIERYVLILLSLHVAIVSVKTVTPILREQVAQSHRYCYQGQAPRETFSLMLGMACRTSREATPSDGCIAQCESIAR